ncbi:MAG: hypothetical protein AB1452_13765 [Pseudomonadota bacterium]
MRERKQYPNVSDEELDRRAEEALRRMLSAPPAQHGKPKAAKKPKRRRR